MEHGVPLAQVRDLLGHASITTTERYDNQTVANLWIAAAKPERRQTFAPPAAKVSRFFQDRPPRTQGLEAKPREWLGRRDSNPNNRVQSAVSYR